jgi:hypothetical protein
MSGAIHHEVWPQLDGLVLDAARPLIISDCDEVLCLFMQSFEDYLAAQGLYFDWASYALSGNVRRLADKLSVPADQVAPLVEAFFTAHTEAIEPVPGAAESLAALSARAQIVVLTNIPPNHRRRRIAALARHGMDYPVVANIGTKGEVVRHLAEQVAAPVFFLDDSPRNLRSVAEAAAQVERLHFVADVRLYELLGPVTEHHLRTTDWAAARVFIERRLAEQGY